jgi:hypothetical protein
MSGGLNLGRFHPNDSTALYYTKLSHDKKDEKENLNLNILYLEPRVFTVRRDVFHW